MFNKKSRTAIIVTSTILALLLVISSVATALSGTETDCEAEVQACNTSVPDTDILYKGSLTQESLKADLDKLDSMLSAMIYSFDIDKTLYSDKFATLTVKFIAELTQAELSSVKFKAMKKSFPEAYSYLNDLQLSGADWSCVTLIPFGIADGDKEAFIKACGAGAEHLGDGLLKVILYEPSAYYDALVPALESTHTETMPSLVSFVTETGLSASKRIEFLAERILAITEPLKKSPLTFLCDIIPDFLINYGKAAELLNSNEKITQNLNLTLPSIDSIVKEIIKALGMTAPEVDYEYLSSLGTASIGESAGNNGERTVINGDREAIFLYLADYITGLFTYENNYKAVEDILLSKIKGISSEEIRSLIYADSTNGLLSVLLDILAKNADTPKDVNRQVEEYNSAEKDFSHLFNEVFTEERISGIIDTLDTKLTEKLAETDISSMIFNDKVATVVSKFTAELCGKELKDISFSALKEKFPEAYNFIKAEQAAGKVWDEIDTIPFGITEGDKEAFVKACGAGAEHFGDALALCVMVSPTSYDDALVPILEALHTGPMPKLREFVSMSGLDGAKRMEDITEKVLSIMEPLTKAPVSYLCEILPDLIYSYSSAAEFMKDDPGKTYVGLHLEPVDELIGNLVKAFNLTLPERSLYTFTEAATASAEESADNCSLRLRLDGDREAVFMSLISYAVELTDVEGNFNGIVDMISQAIEIDLTFIKTLYSWFKEK